MATARKDTTDVIDLLTSQHGEVQALFDKIEEGGDMRALFATIADNLAAHATIEEKIFYPGVMMKQTEDLLHESVEEHLEVKRVLADLLTMKLDDKAFEAKLNVLKENFEHHAHKEEEQKLFPLLRKQLSADVLAALGNECLALFESLIANHPAQRVPGETKAAAPLPAV